MAATRDVEDSMVSLMPIHPLEAVLGREGACVGAPKEWFFPPSGDRRGRMAGVTALMNQAVRVCKTACPVMAECRQFGDYLERGSTASPYVWGVWGGERPFERIKRRKALKVRAA